MYSDELSFGAVDLNGNFLIEPIHSQFDEVKNEIKNEWIIIKPRTKCVFQC